MYFNRKLSKLLKQTDSYIEKEINCFKITKLDLKIAATYSGADVNLKILASKPKVKSYQNIVESLMSLNYKRPK